MKKALSNCLCLCLTVFLFFGMGNRLSAQNNGGERYNLAVYATGLQDGKLISETIKTVAQNTASTKLTGGGNYQLIERSNEFLKQIEEETKFQQSGDVADNQIAELGASYGAQKICVISITIAGNYLYVAARIVDVSTKTSFESGDADLEGYAGIAQIRPTVISAIEPILNRVGGTSSAKTSSTDSFTSAGNMNSVVANHSTTPSTEKNKEFKIGNVNFLMVFVEGGVMELGCTYSSNGGCKSDELPVHKVTLTDYYMGETEVTQGLWEAVMGKNPSRWKGEMLPVEMINWNDCHAFISRLNSLLVKQLPQGYCFALPSEAQWEYAARGGQEASNNMYPINNDLSLVAFYGINGTRVVRQKTPNELGLYDMIGNVNEWCEDKYSRIFYENNYGWTDPINKSAGSTYVQRGGDWSSNASDCMVSRRDYKASDYRSSCGGFRLALVRR